MRVQALVIRILRQFLRDKRTMALMIFAPILVLTMMNLVFNGKSYAPKIGLIDVPVAIETQLEKTDAKISTYETENQAKNHLKDGTLDGYVMFADGKPAIYLEGSDPSVNREVMETLQESLKAMVPKTPLTDIEVSYLHGSSDMSSFDNFGPVLLGYFVFFFVFLIAGVSFLRERTSGTLERLLSSPLRRWEIVVGYVLGFGIFTMIQAGIIAWYTIYVLDMMMKGSFFLVLLITLLLSFSALTLGIFLSAFANNEMQMIQFIPLVIVPQFFFSGMFNLDTISDWLSWIGPLTPLYYAADALRDVMLRGYGWSEIYGDLLLLFSLSIVFMILNIIALKRYRKI
ncbi:MULTISPECIES: ABC transporter permease [unclassified Bacillus (in: firmicutes)]|uniref:ABC transporter permease n=1 Tax=unclassified Bacillus (in: firmicutes) TaxID=185979 RepID=UPI0008EFDD11|nr:MULTISPECIES: ABC transporter permease [unclassified Bacillus (in: firmicutes)]SFB03133.1 ABC-2 type transport system permease protein [Bacillus sp. UNCCL13]SFQ88871.1 ABC-2 type transport system permease protein [Bacillus sp. cl95]